MKAMKKPVVIDYFVHDTSSNIALLEWIRSFGKDPKDVLEFEDGKTKVKTLEGTSYDVPNGYVIIRGVKGEFYPCEPSIFEQTYDKVSW
jgi:hypothetical protein